MDKVEFLILRNLLYNEEYVRKVLPFIKADYFEDYNQKVVFEEICKFVVEYNQPATKEVLCIETEKRQDINDTSFKEITKQWLEYYNDYFGDESLYAYDSSLDQSILHKKKPSLYYSQVKVSPDGEQIAYVSNELGQIKIWIYNSLLNKSDKILKHGHKIKQKTRCCWQEV